MSKATYTDIAGPDGLLARRQPFSASSLSAKAGERVGQHLTGRLDANERRRFVSDAQHGITYLVVSYGTPIAWVLESGEVYHVQQRFSVTTSRHQSCVRAWLTEWSR